MNELMTGLHVMAVDNHYLVRRGIEDVLKEIPSVSKIFMAKSGKDALDYMDSFQPHVVVMDYNMPVMMGDACTRAIKEKYPHVKVIALSGHTDASSIAAMLGSGIDGFLFKDAGAKEFKDAFQFAFSGHFYASAEVSGIISDISMTASKTSKEKILDLDDTEKKIMCMIFHEITNKGMSKTLCCTEKKVEGIRVKLYAITHSKTVVGFILWIMRNGLEGYCEMN